MKKKMYYVINPNCDEDIYEIELTDEELKGIDKYYDIMDRMAIDDMISFPLTEKEFQERLKRMRG